ncbi:MAG TPA: hypothetical protein VEJ86_11295 [Candidatus Binataceae bacterium]|nr:hypothetical protein [Candidatus Binataceae bacterium]
MHAIYVDQMGAEASSHTTRFALASLCALILICSTWEYAGMVNDNIAPLRSLNDNGAIVAVPAGAAQAAVAPSSSVGGNNVAVTPLKIVAPEIRSVVRKAKNAAVQTVLPSAKAELAAQRARALAVRDLYLRMLSNSGSNGFLQ